MNADCRVVLLGQPGEELLVAYPSSSSTCSLVAGAGSAEDPRLRLHHAPRRLSDRRGRRGASGGDGGGRHAAPKQTWAMEEPAVAHDHMERLRNALYQAIVARSGASAADAGVGDGGEGSMKEVTALLQGWRVKASERPRSGRQKNRHVDATYYDGAGRRYKSRAEVTTRITKGCWRVAHT